MFATQISAAGGEQTPAPAKWVKTPASALRLHSSCSVDTSHCSFAASCASLFTCVFHAYFCHAPVVRVAVVLIQVTAALLQVVQLFFCVCSNHCHTHHVPAKLVLNS